MKAKKLFTIILILSALFSVNDLSAAVPKNNGQVTEQAKVEKLVSRLEEIRSLDISKLNSIEKRKLRKEVKSIEYQLQPLSGGVYISSAALLIIIILLIILL